MDDADTGDDDTSPAGDENASPAGLVRAYYRAIDAGDYDALSDLLAPEFRQLRSDRTLDGRDAFVRFMRDERPETDTTHAVDAVFVRAPGDADGGADVIVQGRLRRADGSLWFRFADAFAVADGRLTGLRTYTN